MSITVYLPFLCGSGSTKMMRLQLWLRNNVNTIVTAKSNDVLFSLSTVPQHIMMFISGKKQRRDNFFAKPVPGLILQGFSLGPLYTPRLGPNNDPSVITVPLFNIFPPLTSDFLCVLKGTYHKRHHF
jgi:hypothetical protein